MVIFFLVTKVFQKGYNVLIEFMFQSHMRFCRMQWSATRFYGSLSQPECVQPPPPLRKNCPFAALLKIAFRRFLFSFILQANFFLSLVLFLGSLVMFIFIVLFISCYYFFEILKIFHVPGCSGMFRNVPACSGMFHVPDFIDAQKHSEQIMKMSSVPSMVSSVFYFPLMRISSPFSSFPCTQLLRN